MTHSPSLLIPRSEFVSRNHARLHNSAGKLAVGLNGFNDPTKVPWLHLGKNGEALVEPISLFLWWSGRDGENKTNYMLNPEQVPIGHLVSSPNNVRRGKFVRTKGNALPTVLARIIAPDRYEIIDGEAYYEWAVASGMQSVDAILLPCSEFEARVLRVRLNRCHGKNLEGAGLVESIAQALSVNPDLLARLKSSAKDPGHITQREAAAFIFGLQSAHSTASASSVNRAIALLDIKPQAPSPKNTARLDELNLVRKSLHQVSAVIRSSNEDKDEAIVALIKHRRAVDVMLAGCLGVDPVGQEAALEDYRNLMGSGRREPEKNASTPNLGGSVAPIGSSLTQGGNNSNERTQNQE